MNANLVVYEIPVVRFIKTADSLDYIRSELLVFVSAAENITDRVLEASLYQSHPLLAGQQVPQQDENSCTPSIPFGVWQPALSKRRVVSPEAVRKHFESY